MFTLNLRNRLIFTAADEEDAKASAEFLGKRMRRERSVSRSQGRHTYTYREKDDYRFKPDQLRALRKHQCLLVHCEDGHRKVTIAPIRPDGTVPDWYRNRTLF